MNLKGVRVLVANNTLGNLAGKEFIKGYYGTHRPLGRRARETSGESAQPQCPSYIAGPSRHCHWAQTLQLLPMTLGLSLLPPCEIGSQPSECTLQNSIAFTCGWIWTEKTQVVLGVSD